MHAFLQIKPVESHPYDYIYKWRLQQEHHMKSLNGGKGMTDEQVTKYVPNTRRYRLDIYLIRRFVDRYIPGYVFFSAGITRGSEGMPGPHHPPWLGNGLVIQIGEGREVLGVSSF